MVGGLDDVIHDFGHVARCASTAKLLGSVYTYGDPLLLEIGAWWHDVGRLSGPDEHETRSARMLAQELRTAGVDESIVEECFHAIAFHKWSMSPCSLEGKIIRDADKLDAVAPERWCAWDAVAYAGSTVPEAELDLVTRVACDLNNLISLKVAEVLVSARKSELRKAAASFKDERVSRLASIAAG